MTTQISITYTSKPLSRLCSIDAANTEVVAAGPIARIAAVTAATSPFVAPKERLFGAERVTKMKAHPNKTL